MVCKLKHASMPDLFWAIILLIIPVCAVHCQEEISACEVRQKLRGGTNQCSIHYTGLTFDLLQTEHYLGHRDTNVVCPMRIVVIWAQGINLGLPRGALLLFLPLFCLILPLPSHLSSHSTLLPFPFTLHASAVCHTGPVHLRVGSVSVILCDSCWGRWPAGVLWCNDPCHCLPPPPVIEREKWIEGNGASINTHKETHCRG